MSNYTKSTNFASKDSLSTGNPLKIVKGTEIDTELNNIATAVATKADLSSPALIGTPTAPTASSGTNTTQVATTAFVQNTVNAHTVETAQIEDNAVTNAKMADNSVNTAELVDDSVTTAKIASGAVTAVELASDAVTTAKILDSNVTTAKLATAERMNTSNVATATAGVTAGDVGTYMMAVYDGAITVAFGSTTSGANLRPSNATGNNVGSYQTGTWRCMGYTISSSTSGNLVTLWLRIS